MPPKKNIKKKNELEIINFYDLKDVKKHLPKNINPNEKQHNIGLFFNALLIGATGTGKSNALLNILLVFKKTFNHMYIFTRATEPLYDFLLEKIDDSLLTVVYGYDNFVAFDKTKFYGQSLVIFDDMVSVKNQSEISDFFIRGRKMSSTKGGGCCTIYLTQSYYGVPITIRNNCQYIFILKVPSIKNLTGIIREYGMSINTATISNMYNYCCKQTYGHFLLLDLKQTGNKIYRKNFQEYLCIADFYEEDKLSKKEKLEKLKNDL